MTLSQLETAMEGLLAKSRPRTTLFRHSLDVVKQMAEYYRLYQPKWPVPGFSIKLPRVLAYAALVHDFGKIHAKFQSILGGARRRFDNRHEILSSCFLDWLEIPADERVWIESAIALHHKNLSWLMAAGCRFHPSPSFGADGTYPRLLAEGVTSEDAKLLWEVLSHADEIFQQARWEGLSCYQLTEYRELDYVGLMQQSLIRVDQLASRFEAQTNDFRRIQHVPWDLRRAGIQIRGLILLADHLASAHPHPLDAGMQDTAKVGVAIKRKGDISEFNSHQKILAAQGGSAMLVAPTGTGKTEAGLLWSARQAESGLRGRTFVLLPYQTSMNAMQKRLIDIFAPDLAESPQSWAEHVAMVHGKSVRRAYEQLLEKEYTPAEAIRVAHIESDLARLDVSPTRVCSPYQILRLLFEPKGVEALLQSLSESRLIFDEIHAYNPEVTALTLAATQFLTEQLGARVLFMTATLPAHLAGVIREVFGQLATVRPDKDVMERPPRHRLQILPCDVFSSDSIEAITKAAEWSSVLVVVNQVRRAISLYEKLECQMANVHLLHSRFTNQDRFRIENTLQPSVGKVLVATQAVKVSLDVSYDSCFSELAPLESLLQRFGRCNRYGNESGTTSLVSVFSKFPESGSGHLPYDKEHLACTFGVLEKCVKDCQGILHEANVESMLNASYPEELKLRLKHQISSKLKTVRDSFERSFMPFGKEDQSHFQRLEEQWDELFDGHEVLPESLQDEAAKEESWLARARYLVPIHGRKFAALKRGGKIDWCDDLMCHVVKAPYTRLGLMV